MFENSTKSVFLLPSIVLPALHRTATRYSLAALTIPAVSACSLHHSQQKGSQLGLTLDICSEATPLSTEPLPYEKCVKAQEEAFSSFNQEEQERLAQQVHLVRENQESLTEEEKRQFISSLAKKSHELFQDHINVACTPGCDNVAFREASCRIRSFFKKVLENPDAKFTPEQEGTIKAQCTEMLKIKEKSE